ncbi:MAG: PD-(D/E)XK nuclease family protein [Pirellulales bacterium]
MLIQLAGSRDWGIFPPLITTAGNLPELLYTQKRPLASNLTQHLAWAEVLRTHDPAALRHLIARLPEADSVTRWLSLGKLLANQHRVLAADSLSFDDVLQHGATLPDFQEHDRWQVMADVRRRYLELLDQHQLWDRQTARLFAIDNQECRIDKTLLLVGTVDLNRATREMLDQVADRVTCLIFAPESAASRFDAHGCLVADAWQEVEIPVEPHHLMRVELATQQGQAAVFCLSEPARAVGGRSDGDVQRSLADQYSGEQISIGVPDERLVPSIEGAFAAAGLRTRYGPGASIQLSGVYRLLTSVREYLSRQEAAAFASLVRHPDVVDWLVSQIGPSSLWLAQLDQFVAGMLPAEISSESVRGPDGVSPKVIELVAAIERWLAPLTGLAPAADGEAARLRPLKTLTLKAWNERLGGVVAAIFEGHSIDKRSASGRALMELAAALSGLDEIPDPLQPQVTSVEAIGLLLEQLGTTTIPADPDPSAVELLGWLELPLDDAPVLIVTSVNETLVPETINEDLFLPDRLRRDLGLEDNRRRYARDAYALTLMLHSREHLRLLVPRMDSDGNPLLPSRLLMAVPLDDLPARCEYLFEEADDLPRIAPDELAAESVGLTVVDSSRRLESTTVSPPWYVPGARAGDFQLTSISVTDFRTYLQSPYDYYLHVVERVQEVEAESNELNAFQFGLLAHEALKRFGANPQHRDLTNAIELAEVLKIYLDQAVAEQLVYPTMPAVQLQVRQLRRRLERFAIEQARVRSEGWEIEWVEANPETPAQLVVDDVPVELRGRIDRIDYHPEREVWRVWDYKTGDTVKDPEKAHRKQDDWCDLQLPLYRHICRQLGIEGPIELGYICLSKSPQEEIFRVAAWTEEELRSADETAAWVVRQIRQGIFPRSEGYSSRDWSPSHAIHLHGVLD